MTPELWSALHDYLAPQKDDDPAVVARNAEKWCAFRNVEYHPYGCEAANFGAYPCRHLSPNEMLVKRTQFTPPNPETVAVAEPNEPEPEKTTEKPVKSSKKGPK